MSPRLSFERRGKEGKETGEAERVVLVHGFTQSSGSWAPVADRLVDDFEMLAVDAPNHGRSTAVTAAGLGEAARLLTTAGGVATYVGYSMGGRICLRGALDHPAAVSALVLVSATAGIEDRAERLARQVADGELADRARSMPLEEFLAEWLSGPLFSTLDSDAAGLPARRVNTPAGLARSLRNLGTGSMTPLWDRLAELEMPVLVVAGELDAKFLSIAERLVAGIGPNAALHVVAGAGHAVPFEVPDVFANVLREFLTERGRS